MLSYRLRFEQGGHVDLGLQGFDDGPGEFDSPGPLVLGREGWIAAGTAEAISPEDAVGADLESHCGQTGYSHRGQARSFQLFSHRSAATSSRTSGGNKQSRTHLLSQQVRGDFPGMLGHLVQYTMITACYVI